MEFFTSHPWPLKTWVLLMVLWRAYLLELQTWQVGDISRIDILLFLEKSSYLCCTLGALFAMYLMDQQGRQRLLIGSYLGMVRCPQVLLLLLFIVVFLVIFLHCTKFEDCSSSTWFSLPINQNQRILSFLYYSFSSHKMGQLKVATKSKDLFHILPQFPRLSCGSFLSLCFALLGLPVGAMCHHCETGRAKESSNIVYMNSFLNNDFSMHVLAS